MPWPRTFLTWYAQCMVPLRAPAQSFFSNKTPAWSKGTKRSHTPRVECFPGSASTEPSTLLGRSLGSPPLPVEPSICSRWPSASPTKSVPCSAPAFQPSVLCSTALLSSVPPMGRTVHMAVGATLRTGVPSRTATPQRYFHGETVSGVE
ncbi:unnamed protein product [Caretta caretta]